MLNRREWLRRMSAAAAVPLLGAHLPAELVGWGREVHAAVQSRPPGSPDTALLNSLPAICERIIPTDETPGAIAAGVPQFIDHMLTRWYDATERQRVSDGVRDLEQQARTRFKMAFADVPAAQQDILLLELDALGAKSWFGTVKYLTIWGYYTSEIGVRQELRQGTSPGRYDGFAPYTPRTRASVQARSGSRTERHHAAD